jgi:hypothetical protein
VAGSNPTIDETFDQLGKLIKMHNESEKFGSSNSPSLYSIEDALKTALDGEYTPAFAGFAANLRGALSSQLSRQNLQAIWTLAFAEIARATALPSPAKTGATEFLWELRRYMHANTKSIKTRTMSYGSASAGGGNVGTGTIPILTVDQDGYTIEAAGDDVLTWRCERDQLQTRKGAEVFRVRSKGPARDQLDWEGSAIDALVPSIHAESGQLVSNPSFDFNGASADNEAPASTTAMSGWTFAATATWKHRSTASYVYASYPTAPTTPWGLEMLAGSPSMTQIPGTVRKGVQFPLRTPLLWQLAWKRLASATGTLTVTVGANATATVDVSTGTNGAWNVLRPTLNKNLWYPNYTADDLTITIAGTTIATGTVAIDDFRVSPMANVDGLWYAPMGGSTPFKVADVFTFTHAENATRGILAYWLWQAFGRDGWLPTHATPTYADPA